MSKELDYFTCLGRPRLLNIDLGVLEAKYYELSRVFHPDFFQNKTESEQAISLGNSALLNTAYRTLKDPIRRAEYLIQLEAGSAKDIRTSPPADLFEEILALQENLEEFRSSS
ncbi:MAG: Fe-S protein assembly co-chaperone HscB, partial [Nitrospirota bacterium]